MINVPGVLASLSKRNTNSNFKRKKYVNPNEVKKGIELIVQLRQIAHISSILVITPVRYIVL